MHECPHHYTIVGWKGERRWRCIYTPCQIITPLGFQPPPGSYTIFWHN